MAWTKEFESSYDIIKSELMALRGQNGFQPYRGPTWTQGLAAPDGLGKMSHDAGDWNVFYLFLHDAKFDENCARCPETVRLIEKVAPRHYCHAFFSALTPGSHITHHNGPTNKKLRCHLPLTGCEGAKLRVADQYTTPTDHKLFVMDDSFEHEAWHEGNQTRIVLIFDIWHPDLTDKEVRFLSSLQRSKLRTEQMYSETDKSNDNFYSLIENTKHVLDEDDSWWVQAPDEQEQAPIGL
jgi:aspartate beta-hydroxylase